LPDQSTSKDDGARSRLESGGSARSSFDRIPPRTRFSLLYYLVLISAFLLLQSIFFSQPDVQEWPYSRFLDQVKSDRVATVVITPEHIYGELKPDPPESATPPAAPLSVPAARTPWHLERLWQWVRGLTSDLKQAEQAQQDLARRTFTVLPLEDASLIGLLEAHGVEFRAQVESHLVRSLLMNWVAPFAIMFLIWGVVMRRMGQGGPGVLQMGKSRAKIYAIDTSKRVTFSDLAGVDEAIEETLEVVNFLKDPARFTKLGAKLPKGVLLVGPPGTGKTLLARAIAGEAAVPFFSLSGSDFVEMFVGVGAARVRDLFEEAKKTAPCIIFIDELDAVGRARAPSLGFFSGSNDERENTLNQLLSEMDGFDGSAGVIILAATNRPEILDPALLRAGRFDRRVVVDRPSRAGRRDIFRIHTRKLPLAPDVDFDALAAQTPGMVGADIANVCNEAALLGSRRDQSQIAMAQFQEAIERVIAGPQKKSLIVTVEERRRIAYHESGHALIGYLTPGGDPVQKISIIPRAAGALGYTLQMPLQDRYLLSRAEMLDRVRVLLGGRAAESVAFGSISTGAADDIEKATAIVTDMLYRFGMSESAPNVSLSDGSVPRYLGTGSETRTHSDELAHALDDEITSLIGACFEDARVTLDNRRSQLEALAEALLKAEELDREQVISVLGERPAVPPWQAA
jgi:cell division protease FtsH